MSAESGIRKAEAIKHVEVRLSMIYTLHEDAHRLLGDEEEVAGEDAHVEKGPEADDDHQ